VAGHREDVIPTDLSIARGRTEKAEAEWQAHITVTLISLIACLGNLALIVLSPTFAVAVAAAGQY
jgi:hypothetical protein